LTSVVWRATVRYGARIAFAPSRTAAEIVSDPGSLRCGVLAWLLLSTAYAASVLVGYLNGFGAVMTPWVPIPPEQYYLWEAPLTPVIFLVALVVFSGVVQLLARLASGVGSFEDTFSVIALGGLLPIALLMWLPETLMLVFFPGLRASELGGLPFLPPWLDAARQLAVPVWAMPVYVLALRRVHQLTVFVSALIGLAGLAPAAAVALTYVR
jgi:hypothetical protein